MKELVALKAERVNSQTEYLNDWKVVQRSRGSSKNIYRIYFMRGKGCLTCDPIIFLNAFSNPN